MDMIDANELLKYLNKLEDEHKDKGYKWLYDKARYKVVNMANTEPVNNSVLDDVSFAKRKVCEGCGNKVYSAVGGCCRDCWEDGTATKQT